MRCFIAIELPTPVRERLATLQSQLASAGLDRSVRWTRPEHIHLTLKFLGEVPDADVPEVCSSALNTARALPSVKVQVCRIGCFPPSGPARVVWAGIAGPPPGLIACQSALETALATLGYPPEQRAFRPHLTVGRSRDARGARDVHAILSRFDEFSCDAITAREILVIQSVLGPAGPAYTTLARAPFKS